MTEDDKDKTYDPHEKFAGTTDEVILIAAMRAIKDGTLTVTPVEAPEDTKKVEDK